MRLEADLGALRLHLGVVFSAPWTVIFGPSGSGKSSLLRAMCGLLGTGRMEFSRYANEVWNPVTHIASHLRSIAYAPQGAVLFPHLTVRENVAFASRISNENAALVDESLSIFELATLASRMPRDLSGGQQQRVNLARAFAVPSPKLMLLDEPFSGIDRALRDTLLPKMQERMAALGVPVISVTHHVEEALLLRADVVRLQDGRVAAQGPASVVLVSERDRMVRVLRAS